MLNPKEIIASCSALRGPTVLLDNGSATLLRFQDPHDVIQARQPGELNQALDRLESALSGGSHVAGYFTYEVGYALEQRLNRLQWPKTGAPLLWFGIFDAPQIMARDELLGTDAYAGPLQHEWDKHAYGDRFDRIHRYIADGDIYQANLSFRSRFRFVGDAMALYLRLATQAKMAHGAYIDTGVRQILSLSPELFFEISHQGQITARPMKGTAPRGVDQAGDALSIASLTSSPKERAENLMIVDLLRNDLGRIARTGSVGVSELFAVETYPTLHTMVSTISAQLSQNASVHAILRALFPCGSVTGAPKIRAMEIIREVEQSPRDVYCGAIGYFAPDGSASFNVAIRTVTIEGDEGKLGVGSGIVHDSKPESEYAECLLKARYFECARQPLGLIETLRWDDGFLRLDLHLRRMQQSARYFSIPFDEAKARIQLDVAVSASQVAQRVRLLLNETGEFDCTATTLKQVPSHWKYALSPNRVKSSDLLLQHKTTWRRFYDEELAQMSRSTGCDEVIFLNERAEITQGARTNVFVQKEGRLLTPPLRCGLLGGILRHTLIEAGRCEEAVLVASDLVGVELVWVGNSLRGLIGAVPTPVP